MTRISDKAIARNRDQCRKRARVRPAHQKAADRIARLERRPFIAWDGEGQTLFVVSPTGECWQSHRYILFGSSERNRIVVSPDLSTKECLDLILASELETPDAMHVWFSAEYDVNMILRDLSWRHLYSLKENGVTRWNGYTIKHIPRKMFRISRSNVTATLYDVFGFFHSSYLVALAKYKIGTESQIARIAAGKADRPNFNYANIGYVLRYWTEEIGLMVPLMMRLREICYQAGFHITDWHGPGALASHMLRANGVRGMMSDEARTPVEVKLARMYAFAGGWFMSWRCGLWDGPIYTADINSAYIYACSLLPRLDNGSWERADPATIDSGCPLFGLYRIAYNGKDIPRNDQTIYPLFHRDKQGHLRWQGKVTGWYWGPEARLVIGSPNAKVLEAWVYHDDGSQPFSFVNRYFDSRLALQRMGDPGEKAFKWALAADYGQFARRVGWDKKRRKAPKSHQIEWAGFITSMCRAMVYRAASDVASRGGLICIDTDGVTSSVPFNPEVLENGIGEALGQWKLESFRGILHWQNGIFWTKDDTDNWNSAKARGVPKGRIEPDLAFRIYDGIRFDNGLSPKERNRLATPSLATTRTRFIGYRQALSTRNYDQWRTWRTEPAELLFGGGGKGGHSGVGCKKCHEPEFAGMHSVLNLPEMNPDPQSEPHKLPWLTPHPSADQQNIIMENVWENEIYPDDTI